MGTGISGNPRRAVLWRASIAWMGVGIATAALVLGGCRFSSETFHAKFTRSQELAAPLTEITGLERN